MPRLPLAIHGGRGAVNWENAAPVGMNAPGYGSAGPTSSALLKHKADRGVLNAARAELSKLQSQLSVFVRA